MKKEMLKDNQNVFGKQQQNKTGRIFLAGY